VTTVVATPSSPRTREAIDSRIVCVAAAEPTGEAAFAYALELYLGVIPDLMQIDRAIRKDL
jgi:hypothetical protein